MRRYAKQPFPRTRIRRFLEPGPVVLVSSAWKGRRNVMTLGWHLVLGFSPSLVGCCIWDANHSFAMIRASRECVINLPTAELIDQVVGIGNCSGRSVDKFARFALTAEVGRAVSAPLIAECWASFECRLVDTRLIPRYGLFIFEVAAAHVATRPRLPRTLHYRGSGEFMLSGPTISRRRGFKRQNL